MESYGWRLFVGRPFQYAHPTNAADTAPPQRATIAASSAIQDSSPHREQRPTRPGVPHRDLFFGCGATPFGSVHDGRMSTETRQTGSSTRTRPLRRSHFHYRVVGNTRRMRRCVSSMGKAGRSQDSWAQHSKLLCLPAMRRQPEPASHLHPRSKLYDPRRRYEKIIRGRHCVSSHKRVQPLLPCRKLRPQ